MSIAFPLVLACAVCGAGDNAVDRYGQPDPVAVKTCWDAFAASGARAVARIDCQRAKCAALCGVP